MDCGTKGAGVTDRAAGAGFNDYNKFAFQLLRLAFFVAFFACPVPADASGKRSVAVGVRAFSSTRRREPAGERRVAFGTLGPWRPLVLSRGGRGQSTRRRAPLPPRRGWAAARQRPLNTAAELAAYCGRCLAAGRHRRRGRGADAAVASAGRGEERAWPAEAALTPPSAEPTFRLRRFTAVGRRPSTYGDQTDAERTLPGYPVVTAAGWS